MKATFFEEMSPAIEWNELARKICKRDEENKLTDKEVLDEIDESEEDYDDEEETSDSNNEDNSEDIDLPETKEATTKKTILSTKAPKGKSTAKPKTTTSVPPFVVDSDNENDESAADENYDYNEDDDDDEDREDESIGRAEKPEKNKKILMDGIEVIKKVENSVFGENDNDDDDYDDETDKVVDKEAGTDKKILMDGIEVIKHAIDKGIYGKKFDQKTFLLTYFKNILGGDDNDDDDDNDETEEVVIEEAATNYRFIWPMLIVMLSITVVLLVIMNAVAFCMRKRGERYRKALLMSKNNSIVYQKLSEEITPQTPKIHRYILTTEKATPQTPKAHRYTPIEQV